MIGGKVANSRRHPRTPVPPRRIAVVPVYNEEATVLDVLDRLEPLADDIIVVDDGSSDRSRGLIVGWAANRPHVRPILFDDNRGLSAAYHAAFTSLADRLDAGELSADDAVITADADGQHRPSDIDALLAPLQQGYAAVVARRDLSGYSWFKRFGNWALSVWSSIWAGQRLYDVESGFRVFRLGPLVEALQYYKGYRYSETVEVAVVLPRLGYSICNDVVVPVPVLRSRTRLTDGAIDAVAMVGAWWRVLAGRHRPSDMPAWSIYVFPLLAVFGLLFIAGDLLANPFFLASDSAHNYAHIWYISDQIFDHGDFPIHVSLLDSGRATAFPYGFAPYLFGALIFPLFGDWAVTLLMAIAVVGTVVAAAVVRPAMRDPWLVLVFLLNPLFIDSVYGFQFASLWCALFFLLFVWAFEGRRYLLAALLLWLTVSSHPVVGTAVAGGYGLCILAFDRQKLRPLLTLGVPVALALIPIYWMTSLTPAINENSFNTIETSVIYSTLSRSTYFAMPFLLSALVPFIRRHYRPILGASFATGISGFLVLSGIIHYDRGPSGYYGAFHPGATYRVLEPSEREDGMYHFMRHGAVLSNEFFTESVFHRGWTRDQYACYTAFKGVDYVVFERAWYQRTHMNEGQLLDSLVSDRVASIVYRDPRGRFLVYDVRPFVSEQHRPGSLKECRLF
ncbi:MAG: glycosyltransferase family 2 protein [Chloroflexi bacterium]|nr:MAG: glycosyltransferase family 2 protein [Chloroflexota bacterium]